MAILQIGFVSICVALKENSTLKKIKVFLLDLILDVTKKNNFFILIQIGSNNIDTEVVEAVFKLFSKLNPFNLELLDISVN